MHPYHDDVLRALRADEAGDGDDFAASPRVLLIADDATGTGVRVEPWPVPPWYWLTLGTTTGVERLAEAIADITAGGRAGWLAPMRQLVRADYVATALLVCGTGVHRAPADLLPLDDAALWVAPDAVPVRRLYAIDRTGTEYVLVRPRGHEPDEITARPADLAGCFLLDGALSAAVRAINAAILAALPQRGGSAPLSTAPEGTP